MSRSKVTQVTSESGSEENSQVMAPARKRKSAWRLAAAGVLAIIVGGAIWAAPRFEGFPKGYARYKTRLSQGPPGNTEGIVVGARAAGGLGTGDDAAQFTLGTASPERDDLDLAIAECRKTIQLTPEDADAHCKLGALLIVQGKLDSAIAALREATRLKPGRSDAHCKLGRALLAQGKLAEAAAELGETIRLEPGNLDAHRFLGETLASQGKIDEATAQYVEVDRLKFDPNVALSALRTRLKSAVERAESKANEAEFRGDATAAGSRREPAVEEKGATEAATFKGPPGPRSAAGFYNRSIDLAQGNEYDKAISDLNAAIRLDSKFAAAYVVRGEIWLKLDDQERALKDLDQAIRLDPHAGAYNVRGFIWARKKKYDKAIDDYNEAIRLDPEDARSYYGRGYAWSARKEYEKAITDFDAAIRQDALLADAYVGRGHARSSQKQFDQAIVDFDDAIRLDPKGATAHTGRGYAWSKKNEYEKAIADYDEAIRLNPADSGALNGRAWLGSTCPEAKFRDGTKAVLMATKACELTKWQQPMILDTLAAAYAEAGDFESARKWQIKAIGLLTDEPEQEEIRKRVELYKQRKAYRDSSQ